MFTLAQQSQVMSDLCTDMPELIISSNFIRLLNVVGEGNLTTIKTTIKTMLLVIHQLTRYEHKIVDRVVIATNLGS